jgi:hypothetical protein
MVINLPTVQTSNEALKVMLSEDDKLVAAFKEKVDYLGEFLVQDGQHEAAQFMLVLRGMLDHELYPQKDDLRGLYKKAFDKIWGVLEDSGWLLTQPGAEAGEVQMVCVAFPSYDHYASSDVRGKSIFKFLSLLSCKLCIFLTFLCIFQCLTKVFISSYTHQL